MVRANFYYSGIDETKTFLFGYKFDKDGFAHVGTGEDHDPFIIGITSMSMIDSCIKFASPGGYSLFHADATFKLSDIGYPVITCGFTDQARSYQVGAVFVVSRRTANEYAECFRSFAQLVRNIRGRRLHVDDVMGDAEKTQLNALKEVPKFGGATALMCYFHVLYNVRKRTQHLPSKERYIVMKSIMDMHYCESLHEYETCRDRELAKWREYTQLVGFADYFENEGIKGDFWRWQVYHTPQGYPTTNNPRENFNAMIKSFVQRRRHHMRLLLQKLSDFVGMLAPKSPVATDYVAVTTTELVKAASLTMDSNQY
ncbi:hypothetical protein PC129_g22121 [Phytophthora cactorum]|uniref:MULE transposase domain-containing protein n=2 Tax=Phytophthora cactorum TaxID=29920 RepID=A0A329RNP2_9STRA|nr:hypothetical protein PC111_g22352 [Phytophthora cactorum]KAG2979807.1 hypothetical protein PC119_g21379 [Phytophthora cactorum]KAG3052228.1 hypothetical protein PC122_g22744 [Phytophthora cactorum]KAG3126588.1 hypothetical protein C6341_g25306 [Phytophthora cactorum]KAG3205369.1 hypothetical protein PC129_g22121 [Phytophthora cactorum]